MNTDIAYFIGVLHSDGCIYIFNDKKQNKKYIRLNLQIAARSIPMALKFKKILLSQFNRTVNLRQRPVDGLYAIQTSINRLWPVFQEWYPWKIPVDIQESKELFGSYLGGFIDGDGSIIIKNNKDRRIPQCRIKICTEIPLEDVKRLVEHHFGCKVHFENIKGANATNTCFYISKKNIRSIRECVYPHITLLHKRRRLEKFFGMMSLPGFEPGLIGP